MIHKIKALHNEGAGLSIRSIARELGISRNTVRKYLRMDEVAIGEEQERRTRHKQLDDYRDYIVTLLEQFPNLSAVKVLRKLKERHPELGVSDRSARRYIKVLKETVSLRQKRYYEPVESLPGVQCQVDGGELWGVLVGGEAATVHFVVFVRCPPWRAKRRRVVPGSREATRDTRRAEGAKGDPKGASERGVQSYGRPVCSRNELAMLWRNAG